MYGTSFLFQYCQKLVILSADLQSVLLARRKGEADYDGIYSFIGGKMETTDASLIDGMRREKNEEIGNVTVRILPHETYNYFFRKKDGSSVVLPHIAAVCESGTVTLNDEYSDYKWVPLAKLEAFGPKIENITEATIWAKRKILAAAPQDFVEI